MAGRIEIRADSGDQALLNEILRYPSPPGRHALADDGGPERYATPLQIATLAGVVAFLSRTTIFGAPTEVTLSELALEMPYRLSRRPSRSSSVCRNVGVA